jgi:hypothetical protein
MFAPTRFFLILKLLLLHLVALTSQKSLGMGSMTLNVPSSQLE